MDARTRSRLDRVRILLDTRNDYLRSPRSCLPETEPGPAASSWIKCPDCRGTGRRKRGLIGSHVCPSCDGRGERKRRKGDPEYDGYLGTVLGDASVRLSEPRRAARSVSEGDSLREPWERLREARDAAGSYRELERVLSLAPDGYRWIITARYDHGLDVPERYETEAVAWIAKTMRGPIKVPARYHKMLMAERRRLVRSLLSSGLEIHQVAEEAGVSRRYVRDLIEGSLV